MSTELTTRLDSLEKRMERIETKFQQFGDLLDEYTATLIRELNKEFAEIDALLADKK